MTRCLFCCAMLLIAFVSHPAFAADPEAEIEKLVGKPLAESFKAQYGVVKDPTVTAWVDRVGNSVAAQSPRQDLHYQFIIGDTDIINAFSLPGGEIFVTRGLLDSLDGDDELAGVLAHEVGHEYHYHAAKLLGGELALTALNQYAIRPDGEPEVTALELSDVLALLSFSRHNESEADASGVDFSSKASYDPRGLTEFFQQIDNDNPNGIAELFETHPAARDRIRRVDSRIDSELTDADWKRIADRLRQEGLYGKAAEVYSHGHDPTDHDAVAALGAALPQPVGSPAPATAYEPDLHTQFSAKLDADRKELNGVFASDRINSSLQQLLAVSATNNDVGMIVLAAQAYATEARAQSIAAEAATVTRTGQLIWTTLSGPGSQPVGSSGAIAAGIAAGELNQSAQTVSSAVPPLRTAEAALTAAIVDLDASGFDIGVKSARTAHYGALEAALLLATANLERSERSADQARALLDAAHLRMLEQQLNAYPMNADYTQIVAARLNITADDLTSRLAAGGYGSTALISALAAQVGKSPSSIVASLKPGQTNVDLAISEGASLDSITLVLRMIERDLTASRTATGTTGT